MYEELMNIYQGNSQRIIGTMKDSLLLERC